MEAESRYTYVGAAVLGLLVALVAAVLWLQGVGDEDNHRYAIVFERQDLDGLGVGAAVSLRGIQVGRVNDYALAGEQGDRVRVEVSIDPRVPVFTSTVAVVTRNFVTGLAAITLVNRKPAGPPLARAAEGQALPVIAEGQSEIEEITGRVNKVGDAAAEALGNVSVLLNEQNRRNLMDTVTSLGELAQGINQRLDTVEKSLATVASAATRTGQAATQLGEVGQRLALTAERSAEQLNSTLAQGQRTLAQGEQTLALGQKTLASADTVVQEARQTLVQVNTAVAAVQRQAEGTALRLETTVTGMDDQLRAAVADLRSNTEVAARTMDRLADPRTRLLGPSAGQLGPGEAAR